MKTNISQDSHIS